jgi:hypothetical protein
MRLLQSGLPTLHQTTKPHQTFVAHLLRRLLMLPGHATLRHLSRDSPSHERTFSHWYASSFDVVSLKKAAIPAVMPPAHAQAVVIDASFVPKRGQKTYGLDRFWNGSQSRTEKGLDISTVAWLDLTANCASCLGIEQVPPPATSPDAEATRLDGSLEQLTHVVSAPHQSYLRGVVIDGSDSTQQCLGGVRALGLDQIGTRRLDANLCCLSQGPKHPGPGRSTTSDSQVHWNELRRFENVETDDDNIVFSHQRLNHVQFQWTLRVVLVVDTTRPACWALSHRWRSGCPDNLSL